MKIEKKNKYILLLLLIMQYVGVSAQNTPTNFTGWYQYEGLHAFKEGKPWALFGEAIIKRNEVILDEMQYFLRLGINYNLKSGNRITGGFAYQYTTPYDEVSLPYNLPDYRIWEQYTIRNAKPKGMWTHRFRMEQRWLGRKEHPLEDGFSEYKFENTFRYMIRKTFVINPKWYGIVYDELHLRFLTAEPEKILDQNRVFAGMGVNIDKNKLWRFEFGYMFQPIFNSSPEVHDKSRINHALRLTLATDIPFSKE
jgi:hypothetical protein